MFHDFLFFVNNDVNYKLLFYIVTYLVLISPYSIGSNEFFTVFAKVVSQRFTNKKGNNRLPYLSFPYPILPDNPYTLQCKKNRRYLQTFASLKECLNRFLQMRLQRYKIIFNPPNKIAKLNIFFFFFTPSIIMYTKTKSG